MKPITFLQAKQVIKSPIPFISYSKLAKKPTGAFFLNLSSDRNFTSSAKSKENSLIEPSHSKPSDTRNHSREYKHSISKSLHSYTHNSRQDTKESTINKPFTEIAEENLSDSALTERSISFSAFIIPTQKSQPLNTFSTLCKNINLYENKKKKPQAKRRVKTTEEIELEKASLEREKNRKLRITNNIMIDKLKSYETVHLSQLSRTKVIPKPFRLNVNNALRLKRNEINCCACKPPLTKKKNDAEAGSQHNQTAKAISNKVRGKINKRNHSKQMQSFAKVCLTQR